MADEAHTPIRVQLSRKKGWRMPPNTVKVSRPGRWGNPFRPPYMPVALAVELFRDMCGGYWNPRKLSYLTDADYAVVDKARIDWLLRLGPAPRHAARSELRGKNLACWCKPGKPCHADVLLELANAPIARLNALQGEVL